MESDQRRKQELILKNKTAFVVKISHLFTSTFTSYKNKNPMKKQAIISGIISGIDSEITGDTIRLFFHFVLKISKAIFKVRSGGFI